VPSECSCSVLAPGESLLAAVSLDVALPIGGVTRELHPAALWSLGENHVLLDARRWRHWRRSPWGRRLLRPRLAAVMLVPRYGFVSRCDFPVVRRARRGAPSPRRRHRLSSWWSGVVFLLLCWLLAADRDGWH
jgi:hypothetical protein